MVFKSDLYQAQIYSRPLIHKVNPLSEFDLTFGASSVDFNKSSRKHKLIKTLPTQDINMSDQEDTTTTLQGRPRKSAQKRFTTYMTEQPRQTDPWQQLSPKATPTKGQGTIAPQDLLFEDKEPFVESGNEEEEEEEEDGADDGRLFNEEEYRDITGDTTEEDPHTTKWRQEFDNLAREKAQIEEAIKIAKNKQSAEAKERESKARIIKQQKENIRLLAKLDAI